MYGVDKERELVKILEFIEDDFVYEGVGREQLRSLWTAYCIHWNIIPDTFDWDHGIVQMWRALCDHDTLPAGGYSTKAFDLDMGVWLS